jgi:beta-lactamase regulating signal transducer with metallopeptidase domain
MNTTMAIASAAAFSLLHSLWELALIALLAGAHLATLRRAAARHAMGMGWLLAMAAAPAITFAVHWTAVTPTVSSGAPWLGPAAQEGGAGAVPRALLSGGSGDWVQVCVAQLWLLGVVLMAVRQFGGWRTLRRIERAPSQALPADWLVRFETLRRAMGIGRPVRVRMAAHVASPFTAHVLRPLVWLPLTLLTRLPRDQVEALLAHELAHIRRLDWCWNAIQCVIEAVLFHHPAMWWLSRRIREEREHACDDLAVAACGDAVVLAEALAGLRRLVPQARAPRLALAAQGGFLMRRVAHVLSTTPRRPDWRWPAALLLLLCTGTLLAMQVVPPATLLTNLRYEASSQGELTPDNYREFAASYLDGPQRRYRIAMDESGRTSELYTEDGHARPIDAPVRAWLKTVSVMNAGAPPATLVEPVAPLEPAELPEPAEPVPHGPSDSDEFRGLMATLAADPRVIAHTGRPAVLERKSFHGRLHVWGSRDFHFWGIDDPVGGKADFTATFTGPEGRVTVAWSGKTVAGTWTADAMTITSPAR